MTSDRGQEDARRIRIFGLPIIDTHLAAAACALVHAARGNECRDLAFVNAHCVNVAVGDVNYLKALHAFHHLYADGIGMAMAARWSGHTLKDNVNGTDLFPLLCQEAAAQGIPIALLGARPGVAERCAKAMCSRLPGLQVAWVHHGFLGDVDQKEMLDALNGSGARILLVAMGVPRQELWLRQHRHQIGLPVTLAVGALFDFYSGDMRRAPKALRIIRMEWLFRLAMEPRRLFTRYVIGIPRFILRAIWLRLRGRLRDAPLAPP